MTIELLGSMFLEMPMVRSVHLSATTMIRVGGTDCRRIPSSDFWMYDCSLWAQITTVTSTGKDELLDVHSEQIDYRGNYEEEGEGNVPKKESTCYQNK